MKFKNLIDTEYFNDVLGGAASSPPTSQLPPLPGSPSAPSLSSLSQKKSGIFSNLKKKAAEKTAAFKQNAAQKTAALKQKASQKSAQIKEGAQNIYKKKSTCESLDEDVGIQPVLGLRWTAWAIVASYNFMAYIQDYSRFSDQPFIGGINNRLFTLIAGIMTFSLDALTLKGLIDHTFGGTTKNKWALGMLILTVVLGITFIVSKYFLRSKIIKFDNTNSLIQKNKHFNENEKPTHMWSRKKRLVLYYTIWFLDLFIWTSEFLYSRYGERAKSCDVAQIQYDDDGTTIKNVTKVNEPVGMWFGGNQKVSWNGKEWKKKTFSGDGFWRFVAVAGIGGPLADLVAYRTQSLNRNGKNTKKGQLNVPDKWIEDTVTGNPIENKYNKGAPVNEGNEFDCGLLTWKKLGIVTGISVTILIGLSLFLIIKKDNNYTLLDKNSWDYVNGILKT